MTLTVSNSIGTENTSQREIPLQRIPYVAKCLLVYLIYFLTAKFGLELDAVSRFATFVWPPTGIALAALLLFGYRLCPAIFLGAFTINIVIGGPILVAMGIALGNTLEAVLGVYLLRRFTDFHKTIDRLRDVVFFIVFACALSPLVSATIGVGTLWLGNVKALEGVAVTWRAWWVGDALGDLIVAPLILLWATQKIKKQFKFNLKRIAEGTLLALSLGAVGLIITKDVSRLAFWFFPFVVWGALRFSQIGSVTVVAVISAISVWGSVHNFDHLAQGPLRYNLFLLDSFMVVIAFTGMTLAASLVERKDAINSLRRAVQARDDFLSIASHELKTPLTSLNLQIQMTKQKIDLEKNLSPTPEKLAKIFDTAEKQILRLVGLIEDLMDASRIRTGKFSFNFESTNLSEIVVDMVERFSEQLKKAKCSLEIEAQRNIIGYFDPVRIEQIVDNLLTNVVKYAPEKPVRISLSADDKKALLIVEDQGPGIPMDRRSKIFQRFERVSNSTSVTGLGLGLFIAREIARGHKGEIRLESSPGLGSKFVVELPLNHSKG